ncbi:related to 40S ribosomal protein S27 [Ustilago bromivora]|uniref:40S ribosomal protein S27 n=1 Tax=Ustilago bromivora TaxID=307758 RepID=A0A8H8QL71_9BASI|nr:related to 40S ribosomal protein S27 [Ustilago bromivora]
MSLSISQVTWKYRARPVQSHRSLIERPPTCTAITTAAAVPPCSIPHAQPSDHLLLLCCAARRIVATLIMLSQTTNHTFPFVLALSLAQTLSVDLLNPSAEQQARCHKLKRLVQNPNSFFMDVKCPGCFAITTVFSHAQTVVVCGSCAQVLSQPTGGKARLTEGCSFRKKA